MKLRYILFILFATIILSSTIEAQTVTFESADYSLIGVYDTWEESPFRTGVLEGNVAVIADNTTKSSGGHMLAFQRSRYGSNTYGAKVTLSNTFELTTSYKYVHVFINKPVEGRVMCIGLGKRQDREVQSVNVEQFWMFSTNTISTNTWTDAVFKVRGAGGIDIYSLVIVPDAESTHNLTADFAAYIDSIEVNTSSTPRSWISKDSSDSGDVSADYALNFDSTLTITRSGKSSVYLNSINISGSSDGTQSITVGYDNHLIYHNRLADEYIIKAKAGDTISTTFDYPDDWMNGFIYLDENNDGTFSYGSGGAHEKYVGPSDLLSFSFVETVSHGGGYDMDGNVVANASANRLDKIPAFTLPSLDAGFYRMRFKVDWGCLDPGGCMHDMDNNIDDNAGAVVDVRINIHEDIVNVTTSSRNGTITDVSDNSITSAPFGQAFVVKMTAANGFNPDSLVVRHGYNLKGAQYIHGNKQWDEKVVYADELSEDGTFTIPADIVDGNLLISGEFISTGIKTTAQKDDALTIRKGSGKIIISPFEPTQVNIFTVDGRIVYRGMIETSMEINVSSGVYLINGKCVAI